MQMRTASQWRLDMAKSMAQVFSKNDKVKAIVVGGSVARGIADAYSDLDSIAFCTELPSDKELKTAEQQTPAEHWINNYNFDSKIGIEYRIGTARGEISHHRIERMEDQLADVVDRHQTDTKKHKSVGGLLEAIPLYGEEMVRAWQDKASKYPPELALAMINRDIMIYPLWITKDYAHARNSSLFQYEMLCQTTQKILGILLGLNRIYHPHEFKWLDYYIDKMSIAPQNFGPRLKKAFQIEPLVAMGDIGELVEETFSLIEEHMPEANLEKARDLYKHPTQYCEVPPEGYRF